VTAALIVVLVLAVIVGWVRVALWQRRASVRAPMWRIAALLALQAACAVLLYLTLRPAEDRAGATTLIVATRGAPGIAAGAFAVALPEAPTLPGTERVPDLATALRRYPAVRAVRIVGAGLEPRDREALRGVAVALDPVPLPRGLTVLAPPPRTAAGAQFRVGGRANDLAGGTAELIDPAGTRVAQQLLTPAGRFVLTGTARAAGLATFTVRLRDARRAIVATADVPVRVVDDARPRVLLIGGAPGGELKYLRRWASDAGYAVQAQFAAGGGVTLGDAPVALSPATLARFDLVVLDERSWAAAGGGGRAALAGAVRGGLGLLLRVTGPASPETRGQWRSLGLAVSAGAETKALRLADDPPGDPVLTRASVAIGGVETLPLLRAADGSVVAAWRASGRGRIAVTSVLDSFALLLGGEDARYDALWSAVVTPLVRASDGAEALIDPLPIAGQRVALCGVAEGAVVADPGGATRRLAIDPGAGAERCAGLWPTVAGWHELRQGARRQPFFVYPAGALPGVRARERREATQRLVAGVVPEVRGIATRAGVPWLWPLAFLICAGLLWWLERRRPARAA